MASLKPSSKVASAQSLCAALLLAMGFAASLGCQSTPDREAPRLIYSPEQFRTEIRERVPNLNDELARAPFIVSDADVELAEERMLEAPFGPERVRALVDALTSDPPGGFGLQYHWLASSNASRTLADRRGNCVSLASVLVGLGRGLGWPIYYAEASARHPQTREFEEITFVSDHMVVIIAAQTFQMVIDFMGQVDDRYELRPIDDLTAYAHLINNIAGQSIARKDGETSDADWQRALEGFELATEIEPTLGRAWNNRGIALSRLQRFDEARQAYERALSLDATFASTRHNLEIMETQAAGDTTVAEKPVSR